MGDFISDIPDTPNISDTPISDTSRNPERSMDAVAVCSGGIASAHPDIGDCVLVAGRSDV